MWLLCLSSSENFSESHETVVIKVSCFQPLKLARKKMKDTFVLRMTVIHQKKVYLELLERYISEFSRLQKKRFCCGSSARATEIFDSLDIKSLSDLELELKAEDKERITRNRLFFLEQTSSNLELLFIFLFFVVVYLFLR